MSRLYERNRDLSKPVEEIELVVSPDDEARLDAYLAAKLKWRSRTGARKLIDEGNVTVNGDARKASTRLRDGDRVVITVERQYEGPEPEPPVIDVLYEDAHFLALNKASGTVVHPVGVHQRGTLLQELHRRTPDGPRPKLAHRLDQFTSGVLLVAKNDVVRTAFSDMLEQGRVHKTYQALVLGRVDEDVQECRGRIGLVGDSRILMCIDDAGGKDAHSRFTVLERFAFATHVEVEIFTGRTHQIRIHAMHLGHPLLGDHLYGDGIPVGEYERFTLHAWRTRFPHPVTGESMEIVAEPPKLFADAITLLRRRSR